MDPEILTFCGLRDFLKGLDTSMKNFLKPDLGSRSVTIEITFSKIRESGSRPEPEILVFCGLLDLYRYKFYR
jgi:hypothetical protein